MPRTRTRTTRTPRRKRIWAREEFAVAASATGAAVDLLTDFRAELGVTANPPGITIAGCLLDFVVTRTSAQSADGDSMTYGLLVTNEETPADVQGSLSEAHVDWFWYQTLSVPGTTAGTHFSTFEALGGPVRAKSGRKMDEIGMRLYLVAELGGLTTFLMAAMVSTMVLLP